MNSTACSSPVLWLSSFQESALETEQQLADGPLCWHLSLHWAVWQLQRTASESLWLLHNRLQCTTAVPSQLALSSAEVQALQRVQSSECRVPCMNNAVCTANFLGLHSYAFITVCNEISRIWIYWLLFV